MDNQPSPPVPFSAALPQQQPHLAHHHTSPTLPADNHNHNHIDPVYNEKDAYHQSPRNERGSNGSNNSHGRAHDSVISQPFSPKPSYPPSPTSSVSSAGGRRHRSIPEIQSPTTTEAQNLRYPPQAYLDPEKGGYDSSQERRSHRHSGSVRDQTAIVYDQGKYVEKGPEEKAWQLLFYLSGPCALLSIVITLWTVVALFVSLALAPLKLCTTRPPLSTQLRTFLIPALNLQLHLVYSHNSSTDYSAPMLVVIHLFSPIIALGVAIAAWTAAAFWFFSSILGDPGGHDGHNDGKESILGVRNWWERWLSRALR